MACDCDGEDLWHDWPFSLDCTHKCEDRMTTYILTIMHGLKREEELDLDICQTCR